MATTEEESEKPEIRIRLLGNRDKALIGWSAVIASILIPIAAILAPVISSVYLAERDEKAAFRTLTYQLRKESEEKKQQRYHEKALSNKQATLEIIRLLETAYWNKSKKEQELAVKLILTSYPEKGALFKDAFVSSAVDPDHVSSIFENALNEQKSQSLLQQREIKMLKDSIKTLVKVRFKTEIEDKNIEIQNSPINSDTDVISIQYRVGDSSYRSDVKTSFFHGLYVPNALIPENGIGEQRVFLPKGYGLQMYKCEIMDMNGRSLWSSDSLDMNGRPVESWDGSFPNSHEFAPQGYYLWSIKGSFKYSDSTFSRTGKLMLMR